MSAPATSGGAAPSIIGAALESAVECALGALPGVVLWRNAVIRAQTQTGARILTGIGGEGAPDLMAEIQGPDRQWRCVWLECKAGSGRLSPKQRRWHEAAAREGRHVYTVRSVEHAHEIVCDFQGAGHG